MRSLTENEAIALRALLASQPIKERDRLRSTGLARRTFERIRKRAYGQGWVFDRFVPDPAWTGLGSVHLILARPYAESIEGTVFAWSQRPSNVLLWRWPGTLFGVFFLREPSSELVNAGTALPQATVECSLTASPRDRQVPIYFDFEAEWSRVASLRGTLAYPRPVSSAAAGPAEFTTPLADRSASLARLLGRPLRQADQRAPIRVSPFFLPRSEQRLIAEGVVTRRTFLDPQRVPGYGGRLLKGIAFLTASLAAPRTELRLFGCLVRANLTPFLFASDGTRVLVAFLTTASFDEAGSSAPKLANVPDLRSCLNEMRVVEESLTELTVVMNHRYDRLFEEHPVPVAGTG